MLKLGDRVMMDITVLWLEQGVASGWLNVAL